MGLALFHWELNFLWDSVFNSFFVTLPYYLTKTPSKMEPIKTQIPKIENITGHNGEPVKNQFTIDTGKWFVFQSYSTIIAAYNRETGETFLDKDNWDYSKTTGTYRNKFLNMNKKETEKAIEKGEIILENLN